jgi:tripartite-type tricarboxylate transporter receptor subunit TctC
MLRRSVAVALTLAFSSQAFAETYPDHLVRVIVPTAPGGAIDTVARLVGEKMQAKWGEPVVIENRPGASMRIGAEAVQKAPPDGYVLLVAHDGTMAINPLAFPDLPYDPQKDFTPLGLVVSIPEALMVNKSVPAQSIDELIALAKKKPGQLTHATGGSATRLSLELFKAIAGVDIRSIPYNGGAPAVTATIGGQTSMIIADLTTGNAGLNSDRILPLAVTSKERSQKYPNLPTMNEAGVKGYEVNTWMGFFGPAGVPKEIASAIETAIKEALASPDVRTRFQSVGAVVRSGTADELRQVLASDVAKWSKLVRDQNIKLSQ